MLALNKTTIIVGSQPLRCQVRIDLITDIWWWALLLYGSVSPGQGFWPFNVLFLKKVKPHCGLIWRARPVFFNCSEQIFTLGLIGTPQKCVLALYLCICEFGPKYQIPKNVSFSNWFFYPFQKYWTESGTSFEKVGQKSIKNWSWVLVTIYVRGQQNDFKNTCFYDFWPFSISLNFTLTSTDNCSVICFYKPIFSTIFEKLGQKPIQN